MAQPGQAPNRTRFLAFAGGYHGDTTGAMAVSDPQGSMHAAFRGLLPEQITVDLPVDEASAAAFKATLERHADELAAIIVEPLVQGAGGMRFHDAQVLRTLRAAADRYELLLIFDEIFTGFGRTGTLFAFQAGGRRSGHRHAIQGADRRHAAARRNDCEQEGVRGVLVGRS